MVRANPQNSKDCSDDAYHIGGEIDSGPMSSNDVGARIPAVSSLNLFHTLDYSLNAFIICY